ncbi:MAG: aminoacyl-tRNA hydrolase [Clostridia bacterium]|nr:aminoacyl-tRNA hydrolase [Clostridia bacterium]
MYLIVGLGNPEPEYSRTRHNMGADTINKLSEKFKIQINKSKFQAMYGIGSINNKKVILIKPQTYMNLSGRAVKEFENFYKIDLEKILIIYDDIDIEKGNMKLRKKGGAGSHNGMKSVVQELNSTDFPRIRIGIGLPEYKNDMVNHVLAHIEEAEYKVLEEGIKKAVLAIEELLINGIDTAMNKYN